MLRDLVIQTRSRRRFYQDTTVKIDTLRELVDLARLTASGANLQPLKYILSTNPSLNSQIFPSLSWAGYLKEWQGPVEGERPAAYLFIIHDLNLAKVPGVDHGITAQTIMLAATEKGLGGCIIASFKKQELHKLLNIPEYQEILLVLALGKPKEEVVIERVKPDGDVKYWRDSENRHHVPKRNLQDIILAEYP